MDRREFLQCAAMLAAGTTAMPASWAMNQKQQAFLAAQANYTDRKPLTFFSPSQRALVTIIAEHVIPKTDTPGATDGGCSTGSYFSSQSSTLPAARATGNLTLLPNQVVERLEHDESGKRVTAVKVIDTKTGALGKYLMDHAMISHMGLFVDNTDSYLKGERHVLRHCRPQ